MTQGVTLFREMFGFPGYLAGKQGVIFSLKSNKLLRARPCKKGYLYVFPCKDGENITVSVHRAVAKTWIPNPLKKPEVNHKNGVKSDNRVKNLEWVTKSENELHSRYILGKNIGEAHYSTNLTVEDVKEIKLLLRTNIWTQKNISEIFNVNESVISEINRGLTWRHVR